MEKTNFLYNLFQKLHINKCPIYYCLETMKNAVDLNMNKEKFDDIN